MRYWLVCFICFIAYSCDYSDQAHRKYVISQSSLEDPDQDDID